MMNKLKKIFIFVLVEILVLNSFVKVLHAGLFQNKQANAQATLSPKLQIDIAGLQSVYLYNLEVSPLKNAFSDPELIIKIKKTIYNLFQDFPVAFGKKQGWVRPGFYDLAESLSSWETILTALQKEGNTTSIISPIVQVISKEEFDYMSKGVIQRGKALVEFLKDIYSNSWDVVKDGIIPRSVVEKALRDQGYEKLVGKLPRSSIAITYGPDLSYHNGYVLEDNIGDLGGRESTFCLHRAFQKVFPDAKLIDHRLLRERYVADLRKILLPDIKNIAYWQDPVFTEFHDFLADPELIKEMGIFFIGSAEKRVKQFELDREKGLFVWTSEGKKEKIDYLSYFEYDFALDHDFYPFAKRMKEFGYTRITDGFPGIVSLVEQNKMLLSHSPGSSLADSKLIYPFVGEFIKYYLKENPIFKTARTYALIDGYGLEQLSLQQALFLKSQLVLKPIRGESGEGIVAGKFASDRDWQDYLEAAFKSPGDFLFFEYIEPLYIKDNIITHRVVAEIMPDLKAAVYPGVYVRGKPQNGNGVIGSQSPRVNQFGQLEPGMKYIMGFIEDISEQTASPIDKIYKKIFPKGIPIVQDTSMNGDNLFWEIHRGLFDYKDVFYDLRLAGFLSRNISIKKGDKVLDFGTGTGILGVYAAEKGASRVVSLDIDETACRVAAWNSVKFGVDNIMEVILSDGYEALKDEDLFDTIVFAAPPYTDNKNETDVAVRDYKGENIEMYIKGARQHLLPNGQIILMYPDNPSSVQRVKELGFSNGLIITEQIQWGSGKKLRDFYRTEFKPEHMNITTDIMREKMASKGWFSWSVFKLEKVADVEKKYQDKKTDDKWKIPGLKENSLIKNKEEYIERAI